MAKRNEILYQVYLVDKGTKHQGSSVMSLEPQKATSARGAIAKSKQWDRQAQKASGKRRYTFTAEPY
jgi:hypothetical protein